jgi:NADH dehydrogenase
MARLIITGACGYIGRVICGELLARGDQVLVLGNSPFPNGYPGVKVLPWRLGDTLQIQSFQGYDALIHLAYDWSVNLDSPLESNPNFRGTLQLARDILGWGCSRFIFASTTSAHDESLNIYGKVKKHLETALLKNNPDQVLIAKIGLVYGGNTKGLYGLLLKIVRLSPVIPLVGGNTLLQPIHVSEVSTGMLKLAGIALPERKIYVLANERPIRFDDYLRLLRLMATGNRLFFIPVPVFLALFLCDITRLTPFLPSISRDRIYGLIAARPMKSASDLAELDLKLLDVRDGLIAKSIYRRRILIAEAQALLRYLHVHPLAHIRGLVRAFEQNDGGIPIHLPPLILCFPSLLRLVDPFTRRQRNTLVRRLEMALALQAVINPTKRIGFYQLFWVCTLEIMLLPVRLILGAVSK